MVRKRGPHAMDLRVLYFTACALPGASAMDCTEIGVTTNGGIFKCEMMKTAG